MKDKILTADHIITMDDAVPRATAVAVSGDTIIAVGTLAHCQGALPGATVVNTGATVLMPGFVEPHSHPFFSGVSTQAPARSIAPWDAPTWADVESIFARAAAETEPGIALVFNGFDALLHGRPAPTAADLDAIFGNRVAVVVDNSGHATYFTSALMAANGWDAVPPQDPVGGSFGRTADGHLNGVAYEVPANTLVLGPLLTELGGNVLASAAEYYALMARAGITSTSDMSYSADLHEGYETLATLPSNPLRVSMWQVSTSGGYADDVEFTASPKLLFKQGVKLWTDGSPWIGNIAISFPYLDGAVTELAGINPKTAGGASSMNYTRAEVDAILDECAPLGWQLAFHANGDLAIDFALDAYEGALVRHGLLGADHRWRIEHVGAGSKEQFERAAALGVHISMGPFQYYYWGDLLDGGMFAPEHGARWQAFGDAFESGACVSFHNDGSVSPPTPILNVQTAVTRRTRSGLVHGGEQRVSVDAALRAHTINAARSLHRDQLIGSITPGKLADFVELAADPYAVEADRLAELATVNGTWVGGERIDLQAFLAAARNEDPEPHGHLAHKQHSC
ncbi:amidohydrolase [Arthrobacter sp. HLT1-20]